ncbi:MAG TPA: methyl-accepting chemotaxis protein [Casimicrobiaceae bacterium]|jgi:twitching motility protein PilJ|nr:methyl-accepting chemotaxis protein [Casimicrobiaceae bacterium]
MALSLKSVLGVGPMRGKSAKDAELEMPTTTQVKMNAPPPGYDPLASVSIMEQLRSAAAESRQPNRLWFIGHLPVGKQEQLLGALTLIFLVLSGIMLYLYITLAEKNATSASIATEMQMLSQRLARGTSLAVQGNAQAFDSVRDSRDRFRADLESLSKGGTVRGVRVDATSTEAIQTLLNDLGTRWDRIEKDATAVLDNQQSLLSLSKGLAGINDGNTTLLELAEQAASQAAAGGGSVREIDLTNQLAMLSQRIAKNANSLVSGDDIDPETAFLLGKDAGTFRDVLNGLLKGSDALRLSGVKNDEARATLAELQKRFVVYDAGVNAILQNMQRLVIAKQAARGINQESEPLLNGTTALANSFETQSAGRLLSLVGAIISIILALLFAALFAKVLYDEQRVTAMESEQENKRNQEAILRLLNEMGNLADGDLTVQASVTEDVTGAIADSINFTIEELRTLVKGINNATDQVAKATTDAQAISHRLFEASQRQNKEIQQASGSVLQMAQSINEVSQSAAQSARVAQQSLAAAEKGGQAVQNQIAGMNEIRTQIQDTAKRIKRLGESSLEIGEIVELISDITEQTNVLALNAAIQAASAGEAGRGFTVVAEEVQRLAERSGEATKQIDAIVKTIQADTQDAVAAMEKSTVGVVEGTKLSDAAGQALDEIRRVSRELAELIGGISAQTQRQSASVSDVTRGMQGILKITEETTEGTKQTNVSISQLTKLAAELRSSVAGFKV